jgi:hypothetical protein
MKAGESISWGVGIGKTIYSDTLKCIITTLNKNKFPAIRIRIIHVPSFPDEGLLYMYITHDGRRFFKVKKCKLLNV